MFQWRLEKLKLPLKFQWKITRGSSDTKDIYIVHCSDGKLTAMGEVAGITSSSESTQFIEGEFENYLKKPAQNLEELRAQNLTSSLKFGLESAWTHLEAKKQNQTTAEYLNTSPDTLFPTSYSVPILAREKLSQFFKEHNLSRFPSIKIKVGYERQAETVKELNSIYPGPLRIDANEAFQTADDVLRFYEEMKNLPIEFLEQPIPRTHHEEYRKLKGQTPWLIIADESLQDGDVPPQFQELFDGINVKLMKAGSYHQGIKQLKQAKQMSLKTMLGCMVETSLGIGSALNIAEKVDYIDLDGFLFFKNEPFGFVSERDGILQKNKNL